MTYNGIVKHDKWGITVHADTDNHTDTEILAHIDHEQSQVIDSLHHLHQKLDNVARHLGLATSSNKAAPSLISAHRGSDQDGSADTEHDHQMDSLISQVEATLQHPPSKPPAIAEGAARAESSSIGAAVRKQLDLVGEQLANKVCSIHLRLLVTGAHQECPQTVTGR